MATSGGSAEAAMNHALKYSLVLMTALVALLALYYWSFQSAHLIGYPGGTYDLSVCGIKIPHTAATNAALNRVYLPLRLRHAARLPKKEVQGTIYAIDWKSNHLAIVAPQGNVGCHFDRRVAAMLQRLKEGDKVRATIGWTPGDSIIVYNYKLDSLAVDESSRGEEGTRAE